MSVTDLSSLVPELTDVGLLIGLLTGTEASPELNKDWFSNPIENGLKKGFNWPDLQLLVEKLLGKAANPFGASGGILNETWYAIKIADDTGSAVNSNFYFVEKTVGDNARLGVGAEHTFSFTAGTESIEIQPFIYIPVFTMPGKAGVTPLFGLDLNGPIEIGVEVTLSGTFSEAATSYNGMIFIASFDFTTSTPALTFKLREPGGDYVDFDTANVQSVMNTVLGLTPVVSFLDGDMLPAGSVVNFSWGTLLHTAGLITTAKSPYEVVYPINIPQTPAGIKEYAETLLFNALNLFLSQNAIIPIIKKAAVGDSPAWAISLVLNEGRYGVNINVSNIIVNSSPQIKIQVGEPTNDGTDWIGKAGGTTPPSDGLNFYLLSGDAANISFDTGFELANVGFDVANANGQPLFNINGFAMKEAQLRGYFSTLQEDAWGLAAAINGMSLPLMPPSSGGAPDSVPSTLLTGINWDDEESGDSKPPVNPEFSFLAAYVSSFYFQLFDANGTPEDIVVLPIQKSFGPITLADVGIGWNGDKELLLFQLDGSLDLNALNIELKKLTIGLPVNTPADLDAYTLDMDGMGISFAGGPVTISGGFLKDASVTPAQYNGAVSVQVANWGITALGSFASLNGEPSLFIFGVLNAQLGGPPFFFITGAAVGFGYNRQIIMPSIDNVSNFPFVQAANNPELFSGKGTNDVLASISQYIPPQLGQYWLAAGVKFTSFELLNSFALLMIQFGKKFEVDLLGTSVLQLPKKGEGTTYVNAELKLAVVFDPAKGEIAALAQLTGNSYVIDPACVISGGFAFYSWFGPSPYAGDFVVTLGGYHAQFQPPAYYPTVPRLAFNWNVSSQVKFSGDAYFALTPSCVMAGGKLSLTYSDGDLNAWFNAHADFLISWKPFHYDISIGLSIGVSYRLNLLFVTTTVSVELGINVDIYGPDFGGTAYVDFYIVSFTVSFGAARSQNNTVDWKGFQEYFLPQGDSSQQNNLTALPGVTGSVAVVKINTSAGLIDTFQYQGNAIWIIDPSTFAFNTDSAVPATQINFAPGPAGAKDVPPAINCNSFGVKPLGNITLTGDAALHYLTITKKDEGGSDYLPYSIADWQFLTAPKNVPQALWGTVNAGSETPSSASVPNIISGLASASPAPLGCNGVNAFPISVLDFTNVKNESLPISQNSASLITLKSEGSLGIIAITLYNTTTGQNQCAPLFSALQQLGSLATQNDSLQALAQSAENVFQGSPMLAQTATVNERERKVINRVLIQEKFITRTPHVLAAEVFNYRFGAPTANSSLRGSIASRGNRRHKASLLKRVTNQPGSGSFGVQPGQVSIWSLNDVQANEIFTYDGSLALRLIFFDSNLELIADQLIAPGEPGQVSLPAGAAHLIVRGMNSDERAGLLGWSEAASLPLLNPKYLMGKGCLVRPQSPHRTGRKQFTHGNGLSNGSRVILKNSTRKNNTVTYGWTETMFPVSVKEVFVTGRLNGGKAPLNGFDVRIIYTNAAGKKQAIVVTSHSTGTCGKQFWHKYIIPAGIEASHFSIWVQAHGGVIVSGVAGSQNSLEALSEELYRELAIQESALGYHNINDFTRLTLTNVINEF
jgi:hypothetical protein